MFSDLKLFSIFSPDLDPFTTNGPNDPSTSNNRDLGWPVTKNSNFSNPGDNIWSNGLFNLSPSITTAPLALQDFDIFGGTPANEKIEKIVESAFPTASKDAPTSVTSISVSGGSWSSVVGSKTTTTTNLDSKTNGVIQAPPGFNKTTHLCEVCDEKPQAIAHCNECQEDLCEACVGAHKR